MTSYDFIYNERLRIHLPVLQLEWDQYPEHDRIDILMRWEQIRGRIPDQIKAFELLIMELQNQLNNEEDFLISCALNDQISELASCINDLNLWYRVNQEMSGSSTQDRRNHF